MDAYADLAERMGLKHAVIIQPSVYGADSRCTRDAIAASNGRWRGIAVIGRQVSQEDLEELHRGGFRGIRLNLLHGVHPQLDDLEALCASIAPLGWHLELAIQPQQVGELAARLVRLPVDFAIGHVARLPLPHSDAVSQDVLRLLRSGKCWIKLSGAYLVSRESRPYNDVVSLAARLIEERADRMVWGSNWPHPRRVLSLAENIELLGLLDAWARDEKVKRRILQDNPARLYDLHDVI